MSSDEDKTIPSLKITEEPPNSVEVMAGDTATISCIARSDQTQNIGYSWQFYDLDRVIQVHL